MLMSDKRLARVAASLVVDTLKQVQKMLTAKQITWKATRVRV